jgi:hypothetical protein
MGVAKRPVRRQQQWRKDWERMLDCLSLGYANYLNDHSILAHHDRGRTHPTSSQQVTFSYSFLEQALHQFTPHPSFVTYYSVLRYLLSYDGFLLVILALALLVLSMNQTHIRC